MPNRRRLARVSKVVRRVTTPSDRWQKLGRRYGVGHRAAFLLLFGMMFFAIGVGIWLSVAYPPPGGIRPPDPLLFHLRIPLPIRVLLWCGTGGAAIVLARHGRYQWLSFVALAIPPVERVISYALALGLAVVPGGAGGSMGSYLTMGVIFGGMVVLTRIIASWPDPPGDARP